MPWEHCFVLDLRRTWALSAETLRCFDASGASPVPHLRPRKTKAEDKTATADGFTSFTDFAVYDRCFRVCCLVIFAPDAKPSL